ncbi:deoxyribodipyrimidine photo-lyase [Planosporangium thailandense]|uniref:Deoxyribodipyrimidine photo-lyase n=1 Tax=Planosporangium thailandense TaxID=765197 RepID=A0ABX0XSL2_9ACTN|nr:deoxyribodipyrimidine photo-lyase [Planosporangium thailandense]NJC69002.1 deoxyribodipyrimidine photo-lyase [Planosporangium thailandense]
MAVAVVLFTRDLRVHDNPALASGCRTASRVVPLFVRDPAVPSSPGRDRFLAESLADLRDSLRRRGGDLVIRHGDPVAETMRVAGEVGARHVVSAADVSAYARRRERRLATACAGERTSLTVTPGVTVVAPDALKPYRVFTPYHRAWLALPWRRLESAPRTVSLPDAPLRSVDLPVPVSGGSPSPFPGGETAGRRRLSGWLSTVDRYADDHDDLAGDRTSRLSPYLHFGCLSPLDVAAKAGGGPGAEAFVRQLCWRDFYQQLLYSFPALPSVALRASAPDDWRDRDDALEAWRAGRTGVPIVDAGMRQLAREGWMHNRARLITASFLTRYLGLDWRAGAAHFARLLLDADVASNNGNWQWVAGTGTDTKPYRRFNPIRQAGRFDPAGDYVRRHVPELTAVAGRDVHQPWLLPERVRSGLDYPVPLAGVAPASWM